MTRRVLAVALVAMLSIAGSATIGCSGLTDDGTVTPSGEGNGGSNATTGADGETSPTPEGDISVDGTTTISIVDLSFVPKDAEVKAGASVIWTNDDIVAHTVTGDGWDSGRIEPGKGFDRIFDEPGTYPYYCSIHPDMKARIVVK